MNISSTLGRYLARSYAINMVFMLLLFLGLIYLFDTVELLRRAGKYNLPLSLVLKMGVFKLPDVGQIAFPFVVLFSAIFTFWQLTRRHELVIVRAAGFSIWQFLSPVLFVAIGFGILQMAVINPLGALLLSRFEQMENSYFSGRTNHHVALFDGGIWLRQTVPDREGYMVLHAEKVVMPDWQLKEVMGLFFDSDNNFTGRIDSPMAYLQDGAWQFHDALWNGPLRKSESVSFYSLPTDLTAKEIEESFSTPETMSFWKLPAFIKTVEATGFDSTRLRIHFQSLLARPLLFAAMILLAAVVSMRPPRSRGTMAVITAGILMGFVIFFMSSFLQALGISHQIPVYLAAWSPSVITLLCGLAVILNLEDG